jgi:cyclohexanone monooxygenase
MMELRAPGWVLNKKLMAPIEKIARTHLERKVPDPVLREKLTPRYQIGCKRILISNDWYPTLARPGVEVVTDGIAEVRPHSIVTADGTERPVDTLILATGFHVTDFPAGELIVGGDGRSLADVWNEAGGMEAYKGTTVAGFPNLLLIIGPNTGLGHTSMVFMMESQFNYVLDLLRHVDDSSTTIVEVREDAQTRYNEDVQRRLTHTVWNAGGCQSWYLDPRGRNTSVWPGFTWRFRQITRRFDPEAYVLRRDPVRPGPVPAAHPRAGDLDAPSAGDPAAAPAGN